MMRDIEGKKNLLAVNTCKSELHFATQFTQKAITHITQALNTSLQEFPRFTYEQKVTRTKKEIKPTDIEHALRTTHKSLNKLKGIASNAGLFWYNKIYRTLDTYALQYVTAYGKNTFCAIAGLSYFWWHFSTTVIGRPNDFLESILGKPFHFFEKPPKKDKDGKRIDRKLFERVNLAK